MILNLASLNQNNVVWNSSCSLTRQKYVVAIDKCYSWTEDAVTYVGIQQWMDFWIPSSLGLLWIKPWWTFT